MNVMREYYIDLSNVTSRSGFIEAFNVGFMRQIGGEWNGNLDALNDYLYWPDASPYRLVLSGWKACSAALRNEMTKNGQPFTEVICEILQDTTEAAVVYG